LFHFRTLISKKGENMKRTIFANITLAAIALLFFSNAYAQDMTTFTWDSYHVKFQIPVTFNVDKNTSDDFEAGDGDIYLSIYPKSGDAMTWPSMKTALKNWASDSKVSYDNVNEMEDLNGYWGVYIDGTNTTNDLPATLLLLVHPSDASTKLYVWINYKSDSFNTAVKMLQSFTPTD